MTLINKFDLLQSLVSGVETCNNKRMVSVIKPSIQTPDFFKVSGGCMPYKTSNGKAYARNLLYVSNHPMQIFDKSNKENQYGA